MMPARSSYLVGKAFRGFLLASVLTAAASQVGTLVDGLMLSHFINETAMSAINIASPVMQTLFALCILMGVGGSMLAGVAMGSHQREEASRLFSIVLTAIATLGILLGISGFLFMDSLVALLCPDVSLQPYATEYLGIIVPAAPIYMIMAVTQMFVTLDGEPKRVTAAVACSTAVNLFLDYAFIVWCGWGMTGAAVATVLSYGAALTVMYPHFRKENSLKFTLARSVKMLGKIASMGLPFGIATLMIAVQLLGNNTIAIHYLGGNGIVTLSVCVYLLQFSMILLTGTLESFQPVAAILKGSGDNRGVALVLRKAYSFLAVGLSVLAFVLVLFPDWIAVLFGINDPAVEQTMRVALPAFAANIVLQCIVYLLIPVYQIYNHKFLALIISFGQPLLPMLFFWICSALSASGADWVNPWWGFAFGQICVVLVLLPFTIINKKDGHIPFILIPTDNPDLLFDISVKPSVKDMMKDLEQAEGWLRERDIPEALRMRIVLSCEETLKNVMEHALKNKRKSMIDLRIAVSEKTLSVLVRDEGVPFNPIEQDPGTGIGLLLVKKTCDDLKYEYLFRQNLLTITWNRHVL